MSEKSWVGEYESFVEQCNNGELKEFRDEVYNALQLASEAGEIASLFAKNRGQGHLFAPDQVIEEMGDLLWHLTRLAHQLGVNLEGLAMQNTAKLRIRYPDGFKAEQSTRRCKCQMPDLDPEMRHHHTCISRTEKPK